MLCKECSQLLLCSCCGHTEHSQEVGDGHKFKPVECSCNKVPLYVYCYTCHELIVKCKWHNIAYEAEETHRKGEGCGDKCTIITEYKSYFDRAHPDIELEKPVIIYINNGCVSVHSKPSGIKLEIRDYDVPGDWDEANESCKVDEDGDRYQEMIWESEL